MATIPHTELSNHAEEILRRVKNGEVIDVSINGEAVATLIPPPASSFERLLLAGNVRAASGSVDFQKLDRAKTGASTAELVTDLRGR